MNNFKTLQYFKINNPIIEKNLFNFFGLLESKFICFGLNYKKWIRCKYKTILTFNNQEDNLGQLKIKYQLF